MVTLEQLKTAIMCGSPLYCVYRKNNIDTNDNSSAIDISINKYDYTICPTTISSFEDKQFFTRRRGMVSTFTILDMRGSQKIVNAPVDTDIYTLNNLFEDRKSAEEAVFMCFRAQCTIDDLFRIGGTPWDMTRSAWYLE